MTFGAATITTPRRRLASTCFGPRYDCGKYGRLTVTEIALRLGMSRQAVLKRIEHGWRGERLLLPKHATRTEIRRNCPPPKRMLVAALRIAHRYPDRLPTLEEIKAIQPMSDHYALTWRQTISYVRKELEAA